MIHQTKPVPPACIKNLQYIPSDFVYLGKGGEFVVRQDIGITDEEESICLYSELDPPDPFKQQLSGTYSKYYYFVHKNHPIIKLQPWYGEVKQLPVNLPPIPKGWVYVGLGGGFKFDKECELRKAVPKYGHCSFNGMARSWIFGEKAFCNDIGSYYIVPSDSKTAKLNGYKVKAPRRDLKKLQSAIADIESLIKSLTEKVKEMSNALSN